MPRMGVELFYNTWFLDLLSSWETLYLPGIIYKEGSDLILNELQDKQKVL